MVPARTPQPEPSRPHATGTGATGPGATRRGASPGAPGTEAPAITGRRLVLARGSEVVLSASDFALPAGGVTALIGPNGSGKSSLLDALAGLLPVRSGALDVFGCPAREARTRTAYVLQSTHVNETLPISAREVVTMARYPRRGMFGRLQEDDRRAVGEAMERLAVADLGARHLHELSGGQRQRILVAQGLAQEADLLLLDEPLSGLDILSRERIVEAVEEERRRGRTVVVATHDLAEADNADHVLLLGGRVLAAGPPASVITPEHLADAYGGRVLSLDGGRVLLDDHHHPPPTPPQEPVERAPTTRW